MLRRGKTTHFFNFSFFLLTNLLLLTIMGGIPPINTMLKQKSNNTRDKLLESAASEFTSLGYASTNINEVSVKAGFGKGTIYNYFKNKADLFLAVFTNAVNDITAQIAEAIRGIADPEEKMKVALQVDFNYFVANRDLALVILRESYAADRDNQQQYISVAAPLFELYLGIIQDGMEKGVFSSEIDPWLATSMLMGMSENLMLTQQILDMDFGTPSELADTVFCFFFQGVINRK